MKYKSPKLIADYSMRQTITITLLCLLIIGCASAPKIVPQPDWINSPKDNYVGKCGTHVRGHIAQQECAYKNGLMYIAMSKGISVDVEASIAMKQSVHNETAKNIGHIESTISMDEKNIQISADIINKWHDRVSDVLYVLIKER